MPQFVKKYNKKPISGSDGGGGDDQFPLEDIVASLPSGKSLGPWVDGQTIPLSNATTLQAALEMLAISEQNPTLTPPSISSLTLGGINYNSNGVETGATITNFTATVGFNQGLINPYYTALNQVPPYPTSPRSGSANTYTFGGVMSNSGPSNVNSIPSYVVVNGTNQVSASVSHNVGVQPKTSALNDYNTPLAAGTIGPVFASFQGKYKIFYGPRATNPASGSIDARGLTSVLTGAQIIVLNPGLVERNFYVYIPVSSGLSLTNAVVNVTNENVTSQYNLVTSSFQIPDGGLVSQVLYKEYKMTSDIPYTNAALRHNITIA